MTLGGLALAQGGLQALAGPAQAWKTPPSYGPLSPVADENTGLPLIMLPDGFRYVSFGWTRDPMDDGVLTPPAHDGMAVVEAGHSRLVLVRNHEVRGRAGPLFGTADLPRFDLEQGPVQRSAFETRHPLPDHVFDVVLEKHQRHAARARHVGKRHQEIGHAHIYRAPGQQRPHLVANGARPPFPEVHRVSRAP